MLRKNKPGIAKRKPAPVPELVIGEQTEEGVFLGKWQPKDWEGKSLGKIFNVFAAPQDLTDESGNKGTFTYENTVKRISELKNWNGFDGTSYRNDRELYTALKDGSYNGGWIIPPSELLVVTEPDGNSGVHKSKAIQPDNFFGHRIKGAFKDTFKTVASSGSGYSGWYWSSTERREDPSNVWGFWLSGGYGGWNRNDINSLSCRPVRLVETSAPVPASPG